MNKDINESHMCTCIRTHTHAHKVTDLARSQKLHPSRHLEAEGDEVLQE